MARGVRSDVRAQQSRTKGSQNKLLALLPPSALARLTPHLEPIHLESREQLYRAHEPVRVVYFPDTAVVSLVSRLESGQVLEVGLVGRDGMVGTAVLPGITTMSADAIVQIPGLAHRMSADVFRRELLADDALRSIADRFAHVLLARCMQMSTCNMFHSVEQRCIRWLLTLNDLNGEDELALTHELLATMLGARRQTVTVTLGSLRRRGLINERRGEITIRNRRGLEAACCEYYRAMRDEQRRILAY